VATGFGTPGCEHMADEYVEVKNLFSGARVVEEFLKRFSFANTQR
jgi:acetylornithine deacetylase/succinyl-diaminopimelate desuccinylase-like protein